MKTNLTFFSKNQALHSSIGWLGVLTMLFLILSSPLAQAQEVPGNCASCFDGIDNNGNGLIDAADPACQNLVVDCPGFNIPSLCSPTGGTRADIISTQTRFRNAGGSAVTFTIPGNATRAIVYISSHNGTTIFGATDIRTLADEDFITVNAVLDFQNNTSAGQINYASDTDPAAGSPGMTLFGWQDVAFGSLVSTGALSGQDVTPLLDNINFSRSGNTLTITESNTDIRSSYHVEFTSALTSSLASNGFEGRFLARGTAAANKNLSIPIPANTSIVAVSMKGTNGVTNNNSSGGTEEGFSIGRMLFDTDANQKNGYLTVVNGGDLTFRSTYIVSDRPVAEDANLITVATGDFASKSTTAGGIGLYNPKMYISGGNLIIERDNDYARDYEDTYVIEFFRRIPEPMSAEFLDTRTLFVAKGVNINTTASDRTFDIPAGTNFIYFRQAANSPNSNPTPGGPHNENAQAAYAVIDLQTERANGYYWQQVGFSSPGSLPSSTGRRDDNFVFRGLPIDGSNPKTHVNTVGKQFGSDYNIFFTLSADKTKLTVSNTVLDGVKTFHQILMTADFYGSRPDLAIDPDEVNFSSVDCADIEVTLQVCNPGAGNSPQGMPVSFYVGNPTTDATARRVHTGNFGAAVPIGGCASFTFSFPMGAYSNLNDIDLYMVVNDDGSFAPTLNTDIGTPFLLTDLPTQNSDFRECDYANNLVSRRIQVSNCQVALPDFNITLINTPTSGNVLTNDSGSGLSVTAANGIAFTTNTTFATANGSVTLNDDGTYIYTPNAGFVGVDTFEYTALNSADFSSSTTVTITVYQANPGNNPPVANNDVIDVFANQTATGSLILNDFDPDEDPLGNVSIVGDVPVGLVVNPDGTYTYTPPSNFVGILSFVYQVCDNADPAACRQATAVINVYPTTAADPDPPYAQDDANNGIQGTIISGNALLNDFDPNTPAQTLAVTAVATPTNVFASDGITVVGTYTINAAGVYQFIPANPAFVGTTSFTYQVCNSPGGLCDVATVYLVVQPAAPFAIDDINTVLAGQTVAGNVLTNDQNGVVLPVSSVIVGATTTAVPTSGTVSFTTTNGGTVEIDANGNYTYTPSAAATLAGEDSFTYEICTPTPPTPAVCSQATVYIKVVKNEPFNQAPIAHNDIAQTIGSTPVTSNVLGNDSDPDGNPLTVKAQSISNTNGTFVLGTNGVFTFTPAAGITGTFVYPYEVCDNATPIRACSTAEITVIVYPAPNPLAAPTSYPPFAQDDAQIGLINVNIAGNVLGNDTSPVGGTLTVTEINGSAAGIGNSVDLGATIGSVTLNADGTFDFVPATDFVGTVSFTYRVCNDSPTNAFCDVATVYLSSIPSGTIVASNDINNILQNTTAIGSVATNDDTNGTLTYTGTNTIAGVGSFTINATTGEYTFVPEAGFTGTATFPYTVCNQFGVCATAEVSINVFAPQNGNNPPLVHDDILETYQNITATGNVLSNDNELDFGQTLTVTAINGTPLVSGTLTLGITGGTVTLNEDGTYDFVPATGFEGTTSFEYTACDNATPTPACETATVNITVYPASALANDPPFAQDDAQTGGINTVLAGNVLTNDFDPNDPTQALTVTQVDGAAFTVGTPVAITNGTITIIDATTGEYIFTPSANFTGTTSFTYQVCNITPLCDTATVYLTVHPVAPALSADINNTLMNTPVAGNLLTNDSDPNGGTLVGNMNTTPINGPSNGTIQINTDGTYIYTPNFGFEGTDEVTYEVCNAAGLCERTTLTITVQQQLPQLPVAQNNRPVANNDVGQTLADVNLNGNVLANDFDRDFGQSLTVNTTPVTNVSNGSLTLNANGTYTYIPNAGFVGTDSFEYEVCDDDATTPLCATATVFITVYPNSNALNNLPFAQDDAAFVYQSMTGPAAPASGNALANDFDPDGGTLTVVAVASPADVLAADGVTVIGTYTINATGNYVFTPAVGYTGPANFTYQVCNDSPSNTRCDVATVYITVQAASPLPPLARNDLANTLLNTEVSGTTGFNDLDLFGLRTIVATPALTVNPSHGSVVFNADGTYTYTPNNGFSGEDEFTYQICNSAGLCNVATVKINVIEPAASGNTPPTVQDDYAETIQGNTVNGNLLSNDFDYDGDALIITEISIGGVPTAIPSGGNSGSIAFADGTLVVNSDGTFTLINPSTADTFTFDYTVCDDGTPQECRTATSTITVYPTGSPNLPFTQNDALATSNGNAVVSNVINNDSNLGTILSLTVITPPSNGTLVGPDINGAFTYTPDAGYEGPDFFVYEVCNANGCSQAMVSLTNFDAASPLPISLLSFTASLLEEGKVQLDWATVSEQDNALFEVYRSADAQTWTQIGSKEGAGNSLTRLDYSLIDSSPLAGLNYYRLKQIDFDGTFTYSQIVAIETAQIQWNVYPNPTARFVNIDLGKVEGKVSVQLFDGKGNLLKTVHLEARPQEIIQLDIEELSIAAYYLQINAGNNVLKRVLIKH